MDREYARQEEVQRPWPFSMLSKSSTFAPHSAAKENEADAASVSDDPFYPLSEFKLRHHESLGFPDSVFVSSNYFNKHWSGLRRVKNVVMIMEVAPDTSTVNIVQQSRLPGALEQSQRQGLTAEQFNALSRAHELFGFHATAAGDSRLLTRRDLSSAVHAATDHKPTDEDIDRLINQFSARKSPQSTSFMTLEEFQNMLTSDVLYPVSAGRHW